jgi:hypothetical protein
VNSTNGTVPAGGLFLPKATGGITISDSGVPTIYAAKVEDFPAVTCLVNSTSVVKSGVTGRCTLANEQPVKAAFTGQIEIGDMCGVPPESFLLTYGYPGFRCWGQSDDGYLMVVRDSHMPPYWAVLDEDLTEGGFALASVWIGEYDGVPVDSEVDITVYDWLMLPTDEDLDPDAEPKKICAGSKVKIEQFSDGYWWVTGAACDDKTCEDAEPEA